MNPNRPLRILQVAPPMKRAGTETWLMHVLRHIDRKRFRLDFLVQTAQPCDYDDEIRALGSRIIPCPATRRPLRYARQIRTSLRTHGPYDVVHSHLYHFNGFVLRVAAQAGVPVRIAHSHNDMRVVDARVSLLRRLYLALMQRWIQRYATERIAVSDQGGEALYGRNSEGAPNWRVLSLGIDFDPFEQPTDRISLRAELGLPLEARVLGHVGRFDEQKNHRFLIEILAELARRDPNVYLLLIGEGRLRPDVEREAARRSLQDRIVFAGVRADVPRLMLAAMDVFVFPSFHEGLGLAAVEAQAAGLPCLLSDVIPCEADLVGGLIRRLPLGDAALWANAIADTLRQPRAVSHADALRIVQQSPLNIRKAVQALEHVYEEAHAHAR